MRLDPDWIPKIVDRIYQAGLEPEIWSDVLTELVQILDWHGADYYLISDDEPVFASYIGISTDAFDEYQKEYHMFTGRFRAAATMPEGDLQTDLQFVSAAEMARSPFYRDFLRRVGTRHCLLSAPLKSQKERSIFAVHKPLTRGAPDQEEFKFIAALLPHLRTAGQMQLRLANAIRRSDRLEAAIDRLSVGVLLFDQHGKICSMNQAAEEILTGETPLSYGGGRLVAERPEETRAIEDAVAWAIGPTVLTDVPRTLPVTDADRRPRVSVSLAPLYLASRNTGKLGAVAILAVAGRQPSHDVPAALGAVYGLTPTEASLAVALAAGQSLKDYAESAEVTLSTARSCLREVMAKTDTHRQAELVRLVLLQHGLLS